MSKQYYIYILTNQGKSTLYTGFTGKPLNYRVWEHKQKLVPGFTAKYKCDRLIYYEATEDVYSAIEREKQIKRWSRVKKLKLITKMNPTLRDLYEEING